jgi:DNA helicase-2/ATP-dependent DNA helicase PcrA
MVITTADDLCRAIGISFSDQQLAAITAPAEPGVIVAGAGSGKTTVMAARVVWLVGTGLVRPDQVLGLTFTNKAAAELAARVRAALSKARLAGPLPGVSRAPAWAAAGIGDDEFGEPMVATYHAFAARLIGEHGLRLGIEPDTRLLADASRFQLAAEVIRRHPGPALHLTTHVPTLVSDLLTLDGQLHDHLVTPGEVRRFHREIEPALAEAKRTAPVKRAEATNLKRDELLDLVESYGAAKRLREVMDFADQMALGAGIAEGCPEVGVIERERFRVVLLDEYQDTSIAQRRMLAGLFAGLDPSVGLGHPVTAVGDPCQAIYGWRGASVANLDEFPTQFRRADGTPARVFSLSVNRRSGTRILEVANAHAAPLYMHHRGVEALTSPAGAGVGEIRVALHDSYADEARWTAEQLIATHRADPGLRWSGIGILVHDNLDAANLHETLVTHDIPVEVVGLGGLLDLPEVTDVVATLEMLHDPTANPAVLRLLAGSRWRIGPRDLALLGRRARQLTAKPEPAHHPDLAVALEQAVAGIDPTEVVSLCDALDSPGDLPYSSAARERFAAFSREDRHLRTFGAEPLVDLVRRVIETIGLDIELAASASGVLAARRDNLATFVDAVGSFAGAGGEASLPGLLAYLRAEADYAEGLLVSAPTDADSVKLMTVHKAKGLEWDVVFLPVLAAGVFPSTRGRSRWVSAACELPWPLRGDATALPDVDEWSTQGIDAFKAAAREQEALEERRLGYVALTRPRRLLVASGHWWGPSQLTPRGPSAYLEALKVVVAARGGSPEVWVEEPDRSDRNPAAARQDCEWPVHFAPAARAARLESAEMVRAAVERATAGTVSDDENDRAALGLDELAMLEQWDLELDRLVEEARADRQREHLIELPASMSATQLLRLNDDPAGLAHDLARPMPRRPNHAARFGTRFHAWVESYVGQQRLLDSSDLPGAADQDIADDAELKALCDAFAGGPFGGLRPATVEAPFALALAGRVIRGRIDAVYETATGYEVIDWKTNTTESADPLQLAIYRLAWSELTSTPPARIGAAFYYVRTGAIVRPADLPDRPALEEMLAPAPPR